MKSTSGERISESLKILEEAAKLKKGELKSVLSDKYTNLRSVIVEAESSVRKSLSHAKNHSVDAVTQAKDASVEKVCKIADDVDKNVHLNPWPCIAGTAVVCLLLGHILGRNRK